MKTLKVPVLPIFNVVFFPHTAVPLQLVNPVGIQMIKDCVEANSPVALSLTYNSQTESVSPVQKTCGVGIPIILEEKRNFLKVLVVGMSKVRLIKPVKTSPYPVYEAEIFTDNKETFSLKIEEIDRLKKILNSWLIVAVSDQKERENFFKNLKSVHHIVDYISMFLIQDPEIRQLLLETTSLYDRIKTLNLLLQGESPVSENTHAADVLKNYESIEETAKMVH